MERRKYSNEFKENAVRLAKSGDVLILQVAEDLGINAGLLHKWVRQFGTSHDCRINHTPDEHAELIRLRRELKRIQEERDILLGVFA